jgi:Zn-dependent protease
VFSLPETREAWVMVIMTLVSVLLSITVHEFAHAKTADYLGDDTPRRQGRITLSPAAHLDPIGTIGIFMLTLFGFGFGWGKPVITNPLNYNKASMRVGRFWVTAAGPLSNLVIALICAALIRLHAFDFDPSFTLRWVIITMHVNIGLMFFNLIPVPPLDGSKLIFPLMSNRMADELERQYQIWGIIPLAILLMLRLPQLLLGPVIGWFSSLLLGY